MFEAWSWGTYVFFAVFLAGSIGWVWWFLVRSSLVHTETCKTNSWQPETKGATLEEMDRVFKSRTGGMDAELLEQARRDVGIDSELETEAIQKVATEAHIEKSRA
jgi:hypothetical protein